MVFVLVVIIIHLRFILSAGDVTVVTVVNGGGEDDGDDDDDDDGGDDDDEECFVTAEVMRLEMMSPTQDSVLLAHQFD